MDAVYKLVKISSLLLIFANANAQSTNMLNNDLRYCSSENGNMMVMPILESIIKSIQNLETKLNLSHEKNGKIGLDFAEMKEVIQRNTLALNTLTEMNSNMSKFAQDSAETFQDITQTGSNGINPGLDGLIGPNLIPSKDMMQTSLGHIDEMISFLRTFTNRSADFFHIFENISKTDNDLKGKLIKELLQLRWVNTRTNNNIEKILTLQTAAQQKLSNLIIGMRNKSEQKLNETENRINSMMSQIHNQNKDLKVELMQLVWKGE